MNSHNKLDIANVGDPRLALSSNIFPIANHRKYFPYKSQPTWDTHGWIGVRTHATSTRQSV